MSRTIRAAAGSCSGVACGGEGGIRTHEVFRLSAFQERRHQPLGHLSAGEDTCAVKYGGPDAWTASPRRTREESDEASSVI